MKIPKKQNHLPKIAGKTNTKYSVFLLLLGLFFGVSIAVTLIITERMRNDAIEHGKGLAEVTAQSYAQNLNQSLLLLDTTLSSLALRLNDNQAFQYTPTRLSAYLSETVYFTPQLESLSLLDASGRVIASSNIFLLDTVLQLADLRPEQEQDLAYFPRPWHGTDFSSGHPITPWHAIKQGDTYLVPVSRTVRDGTQKYLLLGTVNTSFFVGKAEDLNRSASRIDVVRQDGVVLMSSDPSHLQIGSSLASSPIGKSLQAGKASILTASEQPNTAFIMAIAPSEYGQLSIVASLSREQVLAVPESEARRIIFLTVGSIVVITLLIAIMYAREQRRLLEQREAKEQELQRQKDLLHALPAAVAMVGKNGTVHLANTGWNKLATLWRRPSNTADSNAPTPANSSNSTTTLPDHLAHLCQPVLRQQQSALEAEVPITDFKEQERWYSMVIRSVPGSTTMGAVLMLTDITQRKNAEAESRLARKVFEASAEGIIITDIHHTVVSANPAAERITGFTAAEMLGNTPSHILKAIDDQEPRPQILEGLRQNGFWQGELVTRRKDGTVYASWMTVTAIRDESGAVINHAGIFSDISERKASEEKIRYLSEHDALTNLPNRSRFQDLLAQAIARSQRTGVGFSLLFIDLDRFKLINDTLGHIVGDHLLQSVAKRIQSSLRSNDALCRQGGDEFLVLLDGVDQPAEAAHVAEKLLEHIGSPYKIDDHEMRTTPSIGIAMYPKDGNDPTKLIKSADMAMYQSKDRGRNTFHFHTESMDHQALEVLSLERGLLHALKRNEICLHYQPLVDIASGQIIGAEALMRWNSRDLGSVTPDRFIPIAESTGHIIAMGQWAMREACSQTQRWREMGFPDFKIAVNVSAIQMEQSNFFDIIQAVLSETGLPPHLLELEVTESMLVSMSVHDSKLFVQLRDLGIGLSIDDFGTGYSSLAYLRRLSVDKLKIDKSFVHDIADDPEDANIIKAIISMAHSLDLLVLAEGVETEGQLAFLREHGCDHMQGYFFSRPLASDAFETLLRCKTTACEVNAH